MDVIEDIGPILGLVAFLGFAILALLIVLQAREVRRLREWAGRAPERALEADEADRAAAEARGEEIEEEEEGEREPGRLGAARSRVASAFGSRWAELDRRSPIDPRWLVAALLAALIAVGVVTSGFGLIGDGDDGAPTERERRGGGQDGGQGGRDQEPTVTVLNATQADNLTPPVPAVAGLADVVASQVVEPAGFAVEARSNAPAGEEQSVIMFEPDAEDAAQELASAVEPDLGQTQVTAITPEISAEARGADLVLLIGLDDSEFGAASEAVAP